MADSDAIERKLVARPRPPPGRFAVVGPACRAAYNWRRHSANQIRVRPDVFDQSAPVLAQDPGQDGSAGPRIVGKEPQLESGRGEGAVVVEGAPAGRIDIAACAEPARDLDDSILAAERGRDVQRARPDDPPWKPAISHDAREQALDVIQGCSAGIVQRGHDWLSRLGILRREWESTEPLCQDLRGVLREPELADQHVPRCFFERQREPPLVSSGIEQPIAMHPSAPRKLHAVIDDEQVAGGKQTEIAGIGDEIGLHDDDGLGRRRGTRRRAACRLDAIAFSRIHRFGLKRFANAHVSATMPRPLTIALIMMNIPVMRPRLPPAKRLVPYLEKIDAARWYSNYGPLVCALEDRLAAHYGLDGGTVTTVANATLGLTLALAAQGARPGTLCALPAWTFIASANAVTMAGLVPYFVDVDPETWAIDPDGIESILAQAPAEIGAVMPVAPFGRPIDSAAWDRFQARAALPVVIDAAAAFDSIRPGKVPAVVSLHATKAFAVGEGGFVMSTDKALVRDVRMRANFGFNPQRESIMPATNAKLSEYHAAVGLAMFDEWSEVRDQWMGAAAAYRRLFSGSNRFGIPKDFGESWIAAVCILHLGDPIQAQVGAALAKAGVETRRWWGSGAHAYPATAVFPRTALSTTDALSSSTIGMPFYRDIAAVEIGRIAEITLDALGA